MDANTMFHQLTDAMERYDFPTARELATALRDRLAREPVYPDGWTAEAMAERLKAVFARTVYPD